MDPGSRSARDAPRWRAASGVAVGLLRAPMGVAVLKAPDLSSAADVRDFYGAHGELVKVVAWLVRAGFFFFLTFLGTLMATLRGVEPGGVMKDGRRFGGPRKPYQPNRCLTARISTTHPRV
jgi:hypothetical protein